MSVPSGNPSKRAANEPLHVRHRRRPAGDARCDRGRVDRRPVRRRPGGRAPRPCARPAARQARARGLRPPARPRRQEHLRRGRDLVPRRGHVRPLRPGADRLDPRALGVPHAVHAVPARDQPGRAAGDVRVPDRDLRADRAAGLERVGLRGPERGRRRRLARARAHAQDEVPRLRGPAPAFARDARDDVRGLGDGDRDARARRRPHAARRGRRRRRGDLRRAAELLRRDRGSRGAVARRRAARCSSSRPTR